MGRVTKTVILLATFFVLTGSLLILAFLPYLATSSVIDKYIEFETVHDPKDWGIEARSLSLSTTDGYELAAWELDVPNPRGLLIFLGGLNHPPVSAFWGHASALAEHGFGSLLIEMRSHGASSGDQVYLGYAEHLDVLAGIDYIRENHGQLPIIAFGADMGGAVAINAAGLHPDLAGVISIGAFSSWADLFADNLYFSGAPLALAILEKPFVTLYTMIKFGFESRNINPKTQITHVGMRPALLIHAQDDQNVSVLNVERILQNVRKSSENVEVWIREGEEHLVARDFLHPANDPEYMERILRFLERHF